MGSRGRSSAMLKLKAWRSDPYRSDPMSRIWLLKPYCGCGDFPEHLGAHCPCDNRGEGPPKRPELVLRELAQKRVNSHEGGYNIRKRCGEHNLVLSANGECSLCEVGVNRHVYRRETQPHQRRRSRGRRTASRVIREREARQLRREGDLNGLR
jgi:hypothetical protein